MFASLAYPLKPTRVCLASNENLHYVQLWEPVAKHWAQIHNVKPTLVFVGTDSRINTQVGDVLTLKVRDTIPTSFVAQCVRLLMPCLFPDDVCVVCDIDLFLLDASFFARYCRLAAHDQFLSLDRYGTTYEHKSSSRPRISMCYQVAKGSTFREIFPGITTLDDIARQIEEWSPRAKTWETDEFLLWSALSAWNEKPSGSGRWKKVKTNGLWGADTSRAIRHWGNCSHDPNLLKNGHYWEFEPPKPYLQHIDLYRRILSGANPGFTLPAEISYAGRTEFSRHPHAAQLGQ